MKFIGFGFSQSMKY